MADELKDQRIPIMMSPSEVKAIDDWMFANRMKSRAEAIRRLCQLGLIFNDKFDDLAAPLKLASEAINNFSSEENRDRIITADYKERSELAASLLEKLFDSIWSIYVAASGLDHLRSLMTVNSIDLGELTKHGQGELYAALELVRKRKSKSG